MPFGHTPRDTMRTAYEFFWKVAEDILSQTTFPMVGSIIESP